MSIETIDTKVHLDAASSNIDEYLGRREHVARELLGIDYEYAVEEGLLAMFYLNPKTGEDGFIHTLCGQSIENEDGKVTAAGFHHAPSSIHESTARDSTHLKDANSKVRKEFRQRRFEPFLARVDVDGHEKGGNSTMYPTEYDPLTVLFAIKQAHDSRDPDKDTRAGETTFNNTGKAIMLDGESTMPIGIAFESESMKIVSAYPISVKNRLNLGHHAIEGSEAVANQAKIDEHLGLK